MVEISIVVPVLNENEVIPELIDRLVVNILKINSNYEIILVDDGSKDNSWSVISRESEKNSKIKGIKLSKNFGHHFAITAGLNHAYGNWVVVMDGDLQDRPEVIPELFKKAQEGFDIVFVSRQNRPEGIAYKFFQKLFYLILRSLTGIHFNSTHANFSIISKKVVHAFNELNDSTRFYLSSIKWLGFNEAEIKANHGTRFAGRPSYTFRKRLNLATDIILSFSNRPLKAAIYLGIIMSATSFCVGLYIGIKGIFFQFKELGWASAMVSIYFMGGTILIVIGILGIYIGQIFQQVKSRPLYVIAELRNLNRDKRI